MKNRNIPIFFTVDDNYVNYLAVTLASLVDHSTKEYTYDIHVLNAGLKEVNYQKLRSFQKDNVTVSFDDVSGILDDLRDHLPVRDYYSRTTYYRLFVASRYPQYDRVLYLDCDIIVNRDVAKLYFSPIGNNLLGASRDSSVTLIPEFGFYVFSKLGVLPAFYFNAGILIMNFKQMRKTHFEEKVFRLLRTQEFPVAQDQDVLNTVCKNKVWYFQPKWNKMPIGKEIKNPCIIHYNLIYKPWKLRDTMYEGYFWHYAQMTGMKSEFLKERNAVTDEMKKKNILVMKNLKRMCLEEGYAALGVRPDEEENAAELVYAHN